MSLITSTIWHNHLILPHGCISATGNIAQHVTTTLISWIGLWMMGWVGNVASSDERGADGEVEKDGRRVDFRYVMLAKRDERHDVLTYILSPTLHSLPMIPLTLLYSSLLPLSLHIILSIYSPLPPSYPSSFLYLPLALTDRLSRIPYLAESAHSIIDSLDHEGINEMWIATHLLSGMSSGLALRVLLPTKAGWTMLAVLGGWMAKAGVDGIFGGR